MPRKEHTGIDMNYRDTVAQQLTVFEQKFKDQCVIAHNGGLFLITPELLSQLSNIKEKSQWVLDMNSNPIFIQGIVYFYEQVYNVYYAALNEYGTAYATLKTQRSVDSILDL